MKNMNFPRVDEMHRRVGRQTALQDGLVGGLHIKLGCGKRRAGGLSSVQCPARQKFTFFICKHGPPARPALQLVLSMNKERCFVFCKVGLLVFGNGSV